MQYHQEILITILIISVYDLEISIIGKSYRSEARVSVELRWNKNNAKKNTKTTHSRCTIFFPFQTGCTVRLF